MVRQQQVRRALGSETALTLRGDEAELPVLFESLWQEINLFEHTFSRFLPDSELSVVNQQAGFPVQVSPEFERLLDASLKLSEKTDGLFNPLVLPALQRAGYKGSWPAPDKLGEASDYSERRIADTSEIVRTSGTVQLPEGSALDFGGIGKGYLLDQLADTLAANRCQHFWLSLGGDIVMHGYDETDEPWRVGIAQADGDGVVAEVANVDGKRLATATSGITKRRGPGWHHIIDPRTGKPAETDVLTATVCDSSATNADVYAKCLVVLGSAQATNFIRQHKLTKTVLQAQDEHGTIRAQTRGI